MSLATSVDVPSLFVTLTLVAPVAAPHGTVAVSVVGPVTVNGADTPPIVTVVTVGFWKSEPVTLTTVPRTPDTGDTGAVTCGAMAQAGRAVMSTPTTPSTSASAVARVDTFFFGNLIWFLLSGSQGKPMGATSRSHDRSQTDEWRDVLESYPLIHSFSQPDRLGGACTSAGG